MRSEVKRVPEKWWCCLSDQSCIIKMAIKKEPSTPAHWTSRKSGAGSFFMASNHPNWVFPFQASQMVCLRSPILNVFWYFILSSSFLTSMQLMSAFMPHLSKSSVETKATSRLMFGFTDCFYLSLFSSSISLPPCMLLLAHCCWAVSLYHAHGAIRVCVWIIKPASSLRSFRGKDAPLQPLLGKSSPQ